MGTSSPVHILLHVQKYTAHDTDGPITTYTEIYEPHPHIISRIGDLTPARFLESSESRVLFILDVVMDLVISEPFFALHVSPKLTVFLHTSLNCSKTVDICRDPYLHEGVPNLMWN